MASPPVAACLIHGLCALPSPLVHLSSGMGMLEAWSIPAGVRAGCAGGMAGLLSASSLQCQRLRSMHQEHIEQGCKMLLLGASGEVQLKPVQPRVGKPGRRVKQNKQASCVPRTGQVAESSGPCTCSRNREGVYINRAPRNCAKMLVLPLTLLRVCRLLGFVMAWRSKSDLFVLTGERAWCWRGGLTIAKQAEFYFSLI